MSRSNVHINDAFIQEVCGALDAGEPIRRRFNKWGILHIDRKLPFICMYRRPQRGGDKGTSELLLGQANYILVDEVTAQSAPFLTLMEQITTKLEAAFGAFLLLELWSQPSPHSTAIAEGQPHLHFSIHANAVNPPLQILESAENALLDIEFDGKPPSLSVNYDASMYPNNMAALPMFGQQAQSDKRYWLGLSLTPVYRKRHKLLPFEIKLVHAEMTRALRQINYAFTHKYTCQRPRHYHELGKHSITAKVMQIDKQIADIKDQFDILFHVTPVNTQQVWENFRESNYTKLSAFKYRARPIDPDLLKRQLYALEIEHIDDPALNHIFQTQREEISRLLTMISDRNLPNFMYGSLQVFGGVDDALRLQAKDILVRAYGYSASQNKFSKVPARQVAKQAKTLITEYAKQAPSFKCEIEIRDDIPGILVSGGKLLVGANLNLDKKRMSATLAHEVSTHVITHFNGSAQPFQQFHSGMQNYESIQEGLAMLSEYFVGGLSASRLRTIAGRVLAVDAMVKGADFITVFKMLCDDWQFSKKQAFTITMRVYRGGGFTKDAVYLRGMLEVVNYLKSGGDYMLLFVGKIALQHIPFLQELKWRKLLKDAQLKPNFIGTEYFDKRMEKLKSSSSLITLINGAE
jgi:uncharacterized protein (TIGR02421 family)